MHKAQTPKHNFQFAAGQVKHKLLKAQNTTPSCFRPLCFGSCVLCFLRGLVLNLEFRTPNLQKREAGFTLLEMLVSTGIFSVVIVTAVGAMLSLNQAQVKASNIQNIQDNVRFTLEFMTKEIRTGSGFFVEQCGPVGCSQLRFTRQDGTEVLYCLDAGVIKRQAPVFLDCTQGSAMTSSAVSVRKLFFSVIGQALGPSDGQPRVTVVIEARSVDLDFRFETDFDLQATITARIRDL